MPTLTLSGCAPVPLAHYLKALGILRLVSEQKDPKATGRWHRDRFVLDSTLDREALERFFLEEYRPTAIMVPWSGGDYFTVNVESPASSFDKTPTASRVVEAILSTKSERFSGYRIGIQSVLEVMKRTGVLKKKDIEGSGATERKTKADLLKALRATMADEVVAWIDAAAVVEPQSVTFNTLLGGGGGSDGNSHFSDNFMQCLWMALEDFADQRGKPVTAVGSKSGFDSRAALSESIFNLHAEATKIRDLSPVLFDSTRVGGVNQSSGFDGVTASNPWDFILMMEGSVVFAGAMGRKLNSTGEPSARFPFLFTATSGGMGSSYLRENAGRELWLPLWSRACPFGELRSIIAEGRIERFGKPAENGVDAFMGAAQLGFDRGISEFRRIGFYKGRVGGDNYFTAIDRGRIKPSRNPSVDLLKSCHGWVDHFRRASSKDKAPASVRRALSVLEARIIDLCISDTKDRVLAVFVALGQCQAAATRSLKWATDPKTYLMPLQGLRKAWLEHGWHRPEFRLAASLASMRGKFGKEWLTLRGHLEQVETFMKDKANVGYRWAENPSNDVQWSAAPLPDVLNDILARRLILTEDPPHSRSEVWASLADIKAFIEGETDDALLSDLLWSMSLVNWGEKGGLPSYQPERVVAPTLYAILKLCFPPVQKELPESILPVPAVPAIHRHAANGNGTEAAGLALRRLRASGYRPLIRQLPVQGAHAIRTAAALLFPISNHTLEDICKQTTRPEKESETASA